MARKGARRSLVAVDIKAKRPDENYLQWRSRLARLERAERDRNEPLVTREAQTHGDYHDESVMHVESFTLAVTKRNHADAPMARLNLDADQHAAAIQIAEIAEWISSVVSVHGSTLERVDHSGSAYDPLVEGLNRIRLEAAYTAWRDRLPMPRRMYIDMVTGTQSLVTVARLYRVPWRQARERLLRALDMWDEIKAAAYNRIDERDVAAVYARIEAPGQMQQAA